MAPEIQAAKNEINIARKEIEKDVKDMVAWRKRNTYSIYFLLSICFAVVGWAASAQARLFDSVKQKERMIIRTENSFYSELEARTLVNDVIMMKKELKAFKQQIIKNDSVRHAEQKKRDSLDLLNKTTIYQIKQQQQQILELLKQKK